MTTQQDWKLSSSFSDRFANLTEITSAYQAAHTAVSIADARQYAKTSEEDIRQNASSLANYQHRCNTLISMLQEQSQPNVLDDSTNLIDDELDNPDVLKMEIGPYKGAVYHRNGITSSVYKVRAASSEDAQETHTSVSRILALKVAELAAMEPPHNVQREVRVLRRAASAHVIPLLQTFHNSHGHLVLVFPFVRCDLPALLARGKAFTQAHRAACLKDLFSAIAHLHGLGIIHRDVKPSNILLASATGPAYLADFGIAWDPQDSASEPADAKITDVGTTCYRPPELLFGNVAYSAAVDLWAAGCVVAEVVDQSVDSLFDAGDVGSDLTLISSIFRTLGTPTLETWPEAASFNDWAKFEFHSFPGKRWSEILPNASDASRDLVERMVRFESGDRLTAAEALEHSFFSNLSKGT